MFQSFDSNKNNDRYVQLYYLQNWYLQYSPSYDKLLALLLHLTKTEMKKTKDKLDFNKNNHYPSKKKISQTTNKQNKMKKPFL